MKTTQSPEEVVRLAKEHGYDLSNEKRALLANSETQGIAGSTHVRTRNYIDCSCGRGS